MDTIKVSKVDCWRLKTNGYLSSSVENVERTFLQIYYSVLKFLQRHIYFEIQDNN